MKPDMDRLNELFGPNKEIARITGASPGAVSRWGRYKIAPDYQSKLLFAAEEMGLDKAEVAAAAGVTKCPICLGYHLDGKGI